MSTQEPGATTEGSVVAGGEGPLEMKELWDSVTEGTFDNLNIDIVFVVAFFMIVRPRAGYFLAQQLLQRQYTHCARGVRRTL